MIFIREFRPFLAARWGGLVSVCLGVILFIIAAEAPCGAIPSNRNDNLLGDGEFDSFSKENIARGWKDNSGWADLKVSYLRDTGKDQIGYAQKIECTAYRNGAVQFIRPGIPIRNGRTYQLSVWLRGDISTPVSLLMRKKGKPYTTYGARAFKISKEWRQYEYTTNITADDENAYFMIRFSGKGILWIDKAELADVTDIASKQDFRNGNLVANSGFEVGTERWAVLVREAEGYFWEMPVNFEKRPPELDKRNAHSGWNALKIIIPEHGRMVLTSPYMRVFPGQEYTLSIWLRADRQRVIRVGIESGYFKKKRGISEKFVIGTGWQQVTFTGTLPAAPENAYHIICETNGPGTVWFDDVVFAAGEEVEIVPEKAEIGFLKRGRTLFAVNEEVPLTIDVYAGREVEAHLTISLVDYYGNKEDLIDRTISIPEGSIERVAFQVPSVEPGYFRVAAALNRNGKTLDYSERAIGILPSLDRKPVFTSPFGNHIRFNPDDLLKARTLGVSWLRMHPPMGTKWFIVEPEKGRFLFHDEPVIAAKRMGFYILGLLDTTPQWASTAPEKLKRKKGHSYRSWAYPPENLDDWESYVFKTVSHYKGIIDHWEVWNEPDSDGFLKLKGSFTGRRKPEVYTNLLRVAYQAAKKANPEATIVGGCGTTQPPVNWTRKIFSEGAFNFLDVLSFHYYSNGVPGDALDYPLELQVNDLKQLIYTTGGRKIAKPIWQTESGVLYPRSEYSYMIQLMPGYHATGRETSAYLVRNYVHQISGGVSKWFNYGILTTHRFDRGDATGFFEYDGSPKPMAIAHAVLSWLLESATFKKLTKPLSDIVCHEFAGKGEHINVCWATAWGEMRTRTVKTSTFGHPDKVYARDIMGRKIAVGQTLQVGEEPIYVISADR